VHTPNQKPNRDLSHKNWMKPEEGKERNQRKKSNQVIRSPPSIKSIHTKPIIAMNRDKLSTLQVGVHIIHNDAPSLIDEGEAPHTPAITQLSLPNLVMLESNQT